MSWVITNDKFFVRCDKRGCATPVIDKRRAKIFDERFNADEFLRSLPKAMKNLGYYVAPADGCTLQEDDYGAESTSGTLSHRKPEITEADYYLEAIASFREFIQTIQKARPKLEEQQIRAEMEIEDLLQEAVKAASSCGLKLEELQELLGLLYRGE